MYGCRGGPFVTCPVSMKAPAASKPLKELQGLLASDDAARVERAVALGPAVLEALLQSLGPPRGLGFEPSWRVPRHRWAHVHATLGQVVLRQLGHLDHGARHGALHHIVPPDQWGRLRGHPVMEVMGVAFSRVSAAAGTATISRDLWVAATPITFRQWQRVVGHPTPDGTDPDAPVFVDHAGAVAFCNALSKKAGLAPAYVAGALTGLGADGYRLLTEAEWEHAARAGTSTDTFAGDVKVRHGKNPHLDPAIRYGETATRTPRVATRIPNGFGLYDMLGLAWERVQDAYPSAPPAGIDPFSTDDELPEKSRGIHVKKGGSYVSFACLCTAETRMSDERKHLAFRVARVASAPRPEILAAAPVMASPWTNVAFETRGSYPGALCFRGDTAWLGLAGQVNAGRILVMNASLTQSLGELELPKAVHALALDVDALWARVGGGDLYAFPRLGRDAPTRVPPFDDVRALASHGGVVVVGSFRNGIAVPGEIILTKVSSEYLHSVAMDRTRIFGGFFDDKIRIFDRTTGKRVGSLKGKSVAVAEDGAIWTADREGTLTCFDETLAVVCQVSHAPFHHTEEIRPWGERLVSWGAGRVQVTDRTGRSVWEWSCPVPSSRITQVTPLERDLFILVADASPMGRILRLTVG